jgi:hypothetical protein
VKFTLPEEVTGGPVYAAGLAEDVEVLPVSVEVSLVDVVPRVMLLGAEDKVVDEGADEVAALVDKGADEVAALVDKSADEVVALVDEGAEAAVTVMYNSSRRPAPQYS